MRLAVSMVLALASACAQPPPTAIRRAVITRTAIEEAGLIQVATVELGGEGLDRDRAAQDLADRFDAHGPEDVDWVEPPADLAAQLAVPLIYGALSAGPDVEPDAAGGVRVLDVLTGQVLLAIEWSATTDVAPFVSDRRVLEPADARWSDAEPTGVASPSGVATWDPFFDDAAHFREPAERTLEIAAVRELADDEGALAMVYVPVDDEVFTVVVAVEP